MNRNSKHTFSSDLQQKIDNIKEKMSPKQIGGLNIASPFILAPLASITNAPFRLLMEDLGAGATVSELISCKGISYDNQKTLDMLLIDPREKNCGIQLFGGEIDSMTKALKKVQTLGASFIDLNLGCPVRKVVSSGGGAALLKDLSRLAHYLQSCRQAISIPLSIKIRSGWDHPNAYEVVQIAYEAGINFVSLHGRTAQMQYRGQADWDYIENVASTSQIPIIGNGDLIDPQNVATKWQNTACQALMIGRGALRNPFIFLQSICPQIEFYPRDYLEVIWRYHHYCNQIFTRTRVKMIQLKKHIAWFSAGFVGVARFREKLFKSDNQEELLQITSDFFEGLDNRPKVLNDHQNFLAGGHG